MQWKYTLNIILYQVESSVHSLRQKVKAWQLDGMCKEWSYICYLQLALRYLAACQN